MSQDVFVDDLGEGAFEIRLERPERMNALGAATVVTLLEAVQEVGRRQARVLLVRGSGRAFCAGADLKERKGMDLPARIAHNAGINAVNDAIEASKFVTVAVMNGLALGGGLEMALACDLRIAAGCTVVLKGSEVAPLSTFMFAEMAAEAGLPPGVFNLVSGTGPEVGEAIAAHPLVDMVSLTGSVRAGCRVMELASRSVKRCHLELGGKSANLVCEDADLKNAIHIGIEDAMRNTGQVCGGLTRVLVPRARLREAEEIAVEKANSYVMGDPWDPATTLGPVITSAARDRVRGYIRTGIDEGARMLCGGPEAPEGLPRGWFVRPTIFSGDNGMRIAREEIFGPVVIIIPYDTEQQAIDLANDSVYGLAGAVWCADPERARSVATQLRTGRVRINGSPLSKQGTHGGFKLSGYGREWGRFGIEEFLEYQSIYG